MNNLVYTSWVNYDPVSQIGEIHVECPICGIIEQFYTMTAAQAFEQTHLNSPIHTRKFYFGENSGHPTSSTLPKREKDRRILSVPRLQLRRQQDL